MSVIASFFNKFFRKIPYDGDNKDIVLNHYPDSTKSRYENTDANLNVRFSRSADVIKGDYVIQEDGTIYLLDWSMPPQPNNKASRAVICNLMLKVNRFLNNPIKDDEELVDELGFVIEEKIPSEYSDFKTICDDIPCNIYHYDGRPEYSAIASHPGVAPNNLIILIVQLNDITDNIRIDDYFTWGNEDFSIIDINRVGVDLKGTGVLKIQAKKKAGSEK